MARIRTVKPEFFLHDGLFDLEQSSGLPVRLAFAGLWCQSDREGRFEWKPRPLKLGILPYDDVDFESVLQTLVTGGFVTKYECDGRFYGCIPSFARHQVVNARESESRLPPPTVSDACLTRGPRVDNAATTRHVHAHGEGKGKGTGRGTGTGKEHADAVASGAESSGRQSGKFDPLKVDVPPALQVSDFLEAAWPEFCRHRRELGKRLTPTATANLLRSLEAMGPEQAVTALRTSIANGWQGVFPQDQRGKTNNGELTFQGLKDFVADHSDEPN